MSFMNRLGNCTNPYQGEFKRVLCVCSAGLLRSPTAALVLSQEPFNHNTRAAGIDGEFALVEVDDVLLTWADEVVCMSEFQQERLVGKLKKLDIQKTIINLDIPDSFSYRDLKLQKLIIDGYRKAQQ